MDDVSLCVPDSCAAGEKCPCLRLGNHRGKSVFSAMYGGSFCCRRSYNRTHYKRNRETYVARATTWNKNNPARRRIIAAGSYRNTIDGKRDYFLQYNYGLTLAKYREMEANQNGVCAICLEPETCEHDGQIMNLSVHHNHTSGKVVALVCRRCNRGMGFFRDRPDLMRRAADLHEGSAI